MAAWTPPPDPPTHPHQKLFIRKKLKFIKGARTWRSILGTEKFFWPLTHPQVISATKPWWVGGGLSRCLRRALCRA